MSDGRPTIVVIGSINMDLVVRSDHVPFPGETVLGRDFTTVPGGKGANQAVAAARLGGMAIMIGRVGEDDFGRQLVEGLVRSGVDCEHVLATRGHASGIAMIVVEDSGENAITVASGANFQVTPSDVDAAADVIQGARVCLLQLELPVETVARAIEICRRHGVETILDTAPAPAEGLPDTLYRADIISPNESEAALLTGLPASKNPQAVAAALRKRGARTVVLKLGQRGAYVSSDQGDVALPGFSIQPVDTTAAGDAFTAALAVGRAMGWELPESVRFANAAGALACTKHGAQPSMPTDDEARALIDRQLPGG